MELGSRGSRCRQQGRSTGASHVGQRAGIVAVWLILLGPRVLQDRPAPTTEAEVFLAIFDYIDRLFAIVRPRKLLYMAIGGCGAGAALKQGPAGLNRGRRDGGAAGRWGCGGCASRCKGVH